ncbi:MAG TPA: alcohol dehydrogenase catalytic domain-containing protein [Candidatus Tumulicola sp.]|nr:alcohol dehydrogenase catalytic domain-containing protein [Candidatus Tumulicola sp.]
MSATGRVAMLVEPRAIELREEEVPAAPPGGMVVRVRAALTDGTDLKAYRRGHPKMPMPTRFGHEFSGDVASVGEGVMAFAPGDAVACTHSAPCGSCYWCAIGEDELCATVIETMILGAYADYVAVPARVVARNAFAKPPGASYAEAAFLEPLSCVMHSIRLLAPREGSTVAVVGDGGFGILHALVLARAGVRAVLIGRRAERLALARDLGVETIDARTADDREALLERSGGRGADALVECTGRAEVWERAPELVRRGGLVSFFGGLPSGTRVCFDAARLHYDRVRLIAPFHFAPQDVRRAYDAIAAATIPLARLISHTYPLDAIAEAFARLDSGDGMKLLIAP